MRRSVENDTSIPSLVPLGTLPRTGHITALHLGLLFVVPPALGGLRLRTGDDAHLAQVLKQYFVRDRIAYPYRRTVAP